MKLWIVRLLLILCASSCWSAAASDCDNPKPLRFAQVPIKNADLMLLHYHPLHKQLEKSLGRRVEIVQASSYNAVVEGLLNGSIDVAELGPAAYIAAKRQDPGIIAFASASHRGGLFDLSHGYQSVLITRADSGLNTLEKLKGGTLSLVDPGSTSGALLPRQAVAKLTGQALEKYFKRVTFAGTHDRAIEAVQQSLVDAAFVSSIRIDEFINRNALRPDAFKIVWQSEIIPHDPFVYRGRLCKSLANQIRWTFLDNPEPLKPMFDQLKQSGFVPVTDEHFEKIRELYETGK